MNENNFSGFGSVLDNDTNSEILAAFVDNALPHGSGINYDWQGKKTVNYVYFTNAYQTMNESGFYIGSQMFTVRFDRRLFHDAMFSASNGDIKSKLYAALIADFTVQFNGNRHLGEYYGLHDYLVDTIAYSLMDYFQRHLDNNKHMILFV